MHDVQTIAIHDPVVWASVSPVYLSVMQAASCSCSLARCHHFDVAITTLL